MKENWLDKTIGFFSPVSARERVLARAQVELVKRHFEGAAHTRRTKGWRTSSGSADAELYGSLATLRNRSRYLVRNNVYAASGVQAIASHTVGEGIVLKPISKNKSLANRIAEAWSQWAETTECDADGRLNFYGIQSLVMREVVESGEVLIRRRRRRSTDGLTVPIQLQVLESDFLDSDKNEEFNNGRIVQGVEYNGTGKVVAYWLFPNHPGDLLQTVNASKRIPASEILHIYRVDRAGQTRGVPWLASQIIKLRDFDEYEDAQLLRQKIASCFAAFVTKNATPDLGNLSQDGGSNEIDRVEPGTVEYMQAGEEVKFSNPPSVDGYRDFSRITLTGVASGLGITYEVLTSDLSNVNYSSGRMGKNKMYLNIGQWRWHMLVPRACDPVFQWFVEAYTMKFGLLPKGATVKPHWTEPKKDSIDPIKEVKAELLAIEGNITTASEVIRGRGYDPDKVFKERGEELKTMEKLGINQAKAEPEPSAPAGDGGDE